MTDYALLSEQPFAWQVSPRVMGGARLDATYYAPKYLDAARQLDELPIEVQPFRHLCSKLNCGSTPKLVEYGDEGMPLIRTTNVRPNVYDAADTKRVSGMALSSESNRAILPGDVLYTMSGTVGYAAVYPKAMELASCSNTIARGRIREDSGHDPYYVAMFLNSSLGYAQSMRLVSGGVLGHVMPNPVKELRIGTPDPAIQRAIGNKVRKAERLRELAASAKWSADEEIRPASFVDEEPNVRDRPRWFGTGVVSPVSWDPEFNRTMETQSEMAGVVDFRDLLAECRAGDPIKSSDRSRGPYRYYGASGPIDWHDSWNTEGERILVAQDGTIGIAVVATGKYWANNHVWICRLKPDFSQRAVARFLTRFYPFWAGLRTGSVVPKITSENLERVSVPIAVAIDTDVGALLERAEAGEIESKACVDTARADVESLINGTLDESALLIEGDAIEQWLADNQSLHDTEKT